MTVDASEDRGWVAGSAPPDDPTGARSRRPALAGALGSAWALLVGVALVAVTVMLAWAVSPNPAGDSAGAWRAVGAVWLAAHQVPLSVSSQSITLLPIGGLLLGLLLTRRSGRWAARLLPEPSSGEVTWVVLGAAAAYGAGGAGVAWVSGGGSVAADPRWAAAITAAIAAVGTLWGVARQAELVAVWRHRTRESVWRTVTAGVAAVLGLLAAGATLVTLGLITGFPEVAGVLADLDPGPVGAAGVTLLGVLSLPTLDIWAMSLVVGPGVDLGGLGGLSAFGGEVESLPALPVLAAIPATVPAWAPVLLAVPVGLGVLAGRIRWGRDLPTPVGALVSGIGIAGVVATLVGGLVVLASGSLGDDRLASLGPPLLAVIGSAAGLVLLGFLAEAGYQSARLTWDLHRAERRAASPGAEEAASEDGTAEDAGDGVASAEGSADADAGPVDDAMLTAGDPPSPNRNRRAVAGRGAAAVAGRVTGAGGAVTSGIAGAGASAVSVVSAAGSAVTALVAGATGALSRDGQPGGADEPGEADPASQDAEVATDPADEERGGPVADGADPDGASGEGADHDLAAVPEPADPAGALETDGTDDRGDAPLAGADDPEAAGAGADGLAGPGAAVAAPDTQPDRGVDAGEGGVVDLRPADGDDSIDLRSTTPDHSGATEGGDPLAPAAGPAPEPASTSTLRAPEPLPADQAAEALSGDAAEPGEEPDRPAGMPRGGTGPDGTPAHGRGGEQGEPDSQVAALDAGAAGAPAAPSPTTAGPALDTNRGWTWAGADDDTDEIPITRRVPAGDPAQA